MIVYRRIMLADVESVSAFALEALVLAGELPLHVSPTKVRSMVVNFAISNDHFNFVAFNDGVPVAALAMWVSEMPFHERCEGCVMLCYAKQPGTGAPLIRRMMHFVRDNMRIRRIQWMMNCGSARLAAAIIKRYGFLRHDNLVYYKGG